MERERPSSSFLGNHSKEFGDQCELPTSIIFCGDVAKNLKLSKSAPSWMKVIFRDFQKKVNNKSLICNYSRWVLEISSISSLQLAPPQKAGEFQRIMVWKDVDTL